MLLPEGAGQNQPRAVAGALVGIHGILHSARSVLGDCDSEVAISECLRLLHEVDDMLNSVAADLADDWPTWRNVRALRDELAGYVLATETLHDVGAKPTAVVALLHRGVDLANATI